MTSRIPPSRRDPEYAPQRAAKALGGLVPGAGRVAGTSRPGVSAAVAAAIRGKPAAEGGGLVLYASIAADGPPTDGSVFWYVTDESC